MTISVSLLTVTNSIAALSVSGVTIKDADEIPTVADKICPVMYPLPNGFITNMVFTRESSGGGGTAKMNLEYTLHYRYLHTVAGANLNLLEVYDALLTNLLAIMVAVFGNDNIAGAVDMTLDSVSDIGPLVDPAGTTTFLGVDIGLRILEFVQ